MREFVESLKRLLEKGRIEKEAVDRQMESGKISSAEYKYILKDSPIVTYSSFDGKKGG